MAVLVLGGYGLIGSAVLAHLRGEALVGLGRDATAARRRWPQVDWREADLSRMTSPEDWASLLADIQVVVNAAGALQQGLRDDVVAVQDKAMVALYAAAREAGVRRIVQISAVGAEPNASTEFLRSKARADSALRASGLEFVILKPGLVISPVAYGGTALLRGLAAFPGAIPLVLAESRVQTARVEDVAELAARAVQGQIPSGVILDVVEAKPHSLAEIVSLFRRWQGLPPAPVLRIPRVIGRIAATGADLLGWFGWRSPLRSTAMTVLSGGVAGDGTAAADLLGRDLCTLPETLALIPAGPQEVWFARLWLAKPLILAVLSAFWFASGAITLARFDAATQVLTTRGAPHDMALATGLIGSGIDIVLGLALLVQPLAALAVKGMIATSLVYLAGSLVFTPDLWLDPLGPLVKVIPAAMLALIALAILEER